MLEADALFGAIADSIPEAVLIFSPSGRLLAVNPAAVALTGLQAEAAGTLTLAELLEDEAAAAAVLAAVPHREAGARAAPLLLRLSVPGTAPGGFRARPWRIAVGGAEAIALRLSELECERHRRVLAQIAEGLLQTRALPAAECQAAGLAAAITEVCNFTGWAYAEAWVPAAAADAPRDLQWRPHPFWYGSRDQYGAFRALSVKASTAAPLPLVSRVAREQSSLWYSDVSAVPLAVYRRARAAREAGLKATFAQPIVENGRTLAVLVFMMAEVRARDDTLAELMAEVARRLVPLFRTAVGEAEAAFAVPAARPLASVAEDAAPSALDMLCRLLDGLGKPAVIVAREGRRIVWVNAAACAAFDHEREMLIGRSTALLHVDAEAFEEFGRRARPVVEAGRPFRQRYWMRRADGTRFATEHLVIPLGEIDGRNLMVSLLTDLGEASRLTFGRRLEQLSAREQEVLQLTIAGETVTEIAARLHLSVRTVEAHRSRLLHKLGCASTTKLLAELLAETFVERARL